MTTVWLNDRPLEEFGLEVASLQNWWNPVGQTMTADPIPGRRGGRASDRGMLSAVRRIPLRTTLSASSMGERLTRLDTIAYAMAGVVEFRISDDPERVAYGTLDSGEVTFYSPEMVEPQIVPTYNFVFANPTKYDRRRRLLVVPGAGGAKAVPCGTAPHRGRLWVMDTLGDRSVDVYHGDGSLLYRLRLTGALATNQYLEIEMDTDVPTITHVSNGTRTDAFSWLNVMDAFPIFDPQDRPLLQHNGGGNLVLSYRRGYQV